MHGLALEVMLRRAAEEIAFAGIVKKGWGRCVEARKSKIQRN